MEILHLKLRLNYNYYKSIRLFGNRGPGAGKQSNESNLRW
jgi:hypothetical protein